MNIVPGVVHSKTKINLHCRGVESLEDSLNYGFSYVEHQDHIVEYIVANKTLMKRIFGEVKDSTLNPENGAIGELWTAKLFLSNKLSDKEIFFSNSVFSVVINLNLNPNPNEEEFEDANIRLPM